MIEKSTQIESESIKFPDFVRVGYQTFPEGSETYLIETFYIREEIAFTLEIGHSYSFVQHGDLRLYVDRLGVRESYSKEYKTEIAFYLRDMVVATIPLEKEDF